MTIVYKISNVVGDHPCGPGMKYSRTGKIYATAGLARACIRNVLAQVRFYANRNKKKVDPTVPENLFFKEHEVIVYEMIERERVPLDTWWARTKRMDIP